MYIIKNAFKNLYRNKSKNILIFIIIFIVILSSVTSLMINNASDKVINKLKDSKGLELTITPDLNRLQKDGKRVSDIPRLTPVNQLKFTESSHVLKYDLKLKISVEGVNVKGIDQDANTGAGIYYGEGVKTTVNPKFYLFGNYFEEFESGKRTLLEGVMPKNINECIVSKEFLELNKLKLGDKIKLKGMAYNENSNNKLEIYQKDFELTITGVYLDGLKEYDIPYKDSMLNNRNQILTNTETILNKLDERDDISETVLTYYLRNNNDKDSFEKELRDRKLNQYYILNTKDTEYKQALAPITGMKDVLNSFLILVLIIGVVIIFIQSTSAIKDRKYEIGVLRAMGMKKNKIRLGLILELLIITLISLVLSFSIGTVISKPLSNSMLKNQIESIKKSKEEDNSGMKVITNGKMNNNIEYIDKVDVSLSTNTIIEVIIISFVLVLIASTISIKNITKYEPMKILRERN